METLDGELFEKGQPWKTASIQQAPNMQDAHDSLRRVLQFQAKVAIPALMSSCSWVRFGQQSEMSVGALSPMESEWRSHLKESW